MQVKFKLNGEDLETTCAPGESLLNVLRKQGCWSVRYGSDTGETGAAAVLLDGHLVSADVVLAAQASGHEVTTVESLDTGSRELHPIQAAFVDIGALQGGYSAGAMVLATKALLDELPDPTDSEIRDAFSGILDRETGYVKVVEAVKRAATALRGSKPGPIEPPLLDPVDLDDALAGVLREVDVETLAIPRIVPSEDVPRTAVVGRPEPKVDALRLVKGYAAFADDVEPRGLLSARLLTSPHAHARIVAIDDSRAQALPGVHAVLHHFNTPHLRYASGGQSWPNPYPWDQVSFDDKVRFVGDRVAAVATETPEIAEQACELIDVTYDVVPAVLTAEEATRPGAPVIHDEPDSIGIYDAARNLSHHIEGRTVTDEELEAAFASADHVFTGTFHVQKQQHTPIEPHAVVGWLDEDERLVLRSSTQVPFQLRRMVAPLLGLEVKDVHVVKPRLGGGFGSKQEMVTDDVVGLLVLATRRPVRLVLDREQEFVSTRRRHSQALTFRTGVNADGTLIAQDLTVLADTGAYGTHGFTVQSLTGARGLSSYNCPAKRYRCDVAYTNTPVAGAFRGYGAPQAFFALESHLDDIAAAIGIGPVELRRHNWVKTGDRLDIVTRLGERGGVEEIAEADLPMVTSCGTEQCVAQGIRAIGWQRRGDPLYQRPPDRPNLRRGIGLALCMQGSSIPFVDLAAGSIKMNDDGSFNLLTGAADVGAGADTVFAQIAAEVLGVRPTDIVVYSGDTDVTPFDKGAYASSTTYLSGMAVKQAAEAARARITLRAARLLAVDDPAGIELHDHRAWAADGRSVALSAIALNSLHTEDQEQIIGVASHWSPKSPAPFGAQFAEVEVDIETGEVTVTRLVMAVDCGVPVNSLGASGQVEGGMAQALGYALTEELVLDEAGRPVNARLGPYWIFRSDDMPPMEVILVETMEPSGPFGAKSIGEIPIDGVAPAVRNAIRDATGVAINTLPLTPERVWKALHAANV